MFDANLLSINGAVTTTATGSALKLRGTDKVGRHVMGFHIPSTLGSTTSFLPKVQFSADNSTWVDGAFYEGGAQLPTLAAGTKGMYQVPFETNLKYARALITITGTTPVFGTCVAGIISDVGGEWSRAVDWT